MKFIKLKTSLLLSATFAVSTQIASAQAAEATDVNNTDASNIVAMQAND